MPKTSTAAKSAATKTAAAPKRKPITPTSAQRDAFHYLWAIDGKFDPEKATFALALLAPFCEGDPWAEGSLAEAHRQAKDYVEILADDYKSKATTREAREDRKWDLEIAESGISDLVMLLDDVPGFDRPGWALRK